ncbi:MAG: hypothetical protein HC837_19590 [Chloroflexaceae bacterium]|nr:hypothetical protein [Chloroflexaceae bacterium]
MSDTKYERVQTIRSMLAEETHYNLSMQQVLAELPDDQLDVLEHLVERCRSTRNQQLTGGHEPYRADELVLLTFA